MAIITLTSDWGTKGYFAAAVKGAILKYVPDANIIDISHQITPFNIYEASYVLKNSYKNYPEGSIHIIGVDTEESSENPFLVVKYDNHFFVGADKGVFSYIAEKSFDEIYQIDMLSDSPFFTFPSRDLFPKAVKKIIDNDLSSIGKKVESVNDMSRQIAFKKGKSIFGNIIYVDNYSNAITNITRDFFDNATKGADFKIKFLTYKLDHIVESYSDVNEGEILAIFDSSDHLVLAQNKGNLSELLGIDLQVVVRIDIER